jgi:hypothetical protein
MKGTEILCVLEPKALSLVMQAHSLLDFSH